MRRITVALGLAVFMVVASGVGEVTSMFCINDASTVYAQECGDGGGGDQGDRPECEPGNPGGSDGCTWRVACIWIGFPLCWTWLDCG